MADEFRDKRRKIDEDSFVFSRGERPPPPPPEDLPQGRGGGGHFPPPPAHRMEGSPPNRREYSPSSGQKRRRDDWESRGDYTRSTSPGDGYGGGRDFRPGDDRDRPAFSPPRRGQPPPSYHRGGGRDDSNPSPRRQSRGLDGDYRYNQPDDISLGRWTFRRALFDTPEFKPVKQMAEFSVSPIRTEDLAEAHKEYVAEYNRRNSKHFFHEHKHEEWFKDRYSGQRLLAGWSARTERARREAQQFWVDLAVGTLSCNLNADENEHLIPKSKKPQPQSTVPTSAPATTATGGDGMDAEAPPAPADKSSEQAPAAAAPAVQEEVYDQTADENPAVGLAESEDGQVTTDKPTEAAKTTNGAKVVPVEVFHAIPAFPDAPSTRPTIPALFIKNIPVDVSKAMLWNVLNKSNAVVQLIVADAQPTKNFTRVAWAECVNQEAADTIIKEAHGHRFPNGWEMSLVAHKGHGFYRRVKVTPAVFSTPERIAVDLEQIVKLTQVLDQEKRIELNPLLSVDTELKADLKLATRRLDELVTYLRKVHWYSYYHGLEFLHDDQIFLKKGEVTLRGTEKYKSKKDPVEWAANLDKAIAQRLSSPFDINVQKGLQHVEKIVDELYIKYAEQIGENKVKCLMDGCNKLFRSMEFIRKHLVLKHPESFPQEADEEQSYVNYINDPFRVTPAQIGQLRHQDHGHGQQQPGRGQNRRQGGGGGGNRGPNSRRQGGGGGAVGPRGPPPGTANPPPGRKLVSYVDLDAPADSNSDINWGF